MAKKRKLLQQKQKRTQHQLKDKDKATNHKAGKQEAKSSTLQDLKPTIPFSPEDAILLVGEGDLSFSKALVEHHYCENVTATVLEPNREELITKYPQAKENAEAIEAEGSKVVCGVDAKKMGPFAQRSGKESTGTMDRISMPSPSRPLRQHWQSSVWLTV